MDIYGHPDFKAFLGDVEGMLKAHQASLESSKSWDDTIRTQSAIIALRAVLDIPGHKARAAAEAERKRVQQSRRTT